MEKLDISDTTVNMDQMARSQSLITGATLLYSGISHLKKQPTVSALKTILGAYLLYRGFTGHCHLNQIMGRDTNYEM